MSNIMLQFPKFKNGIEILPMSTIRQLTEGTVSKSLESVYEESIEESLQNLMKHINNDTGGSDGTIPQKLIDEANNISKLSVNDIAKYLYKRDDSRHKTIRIAISKRIANIKAKLYKQPLEVFLDEVQRLVSQTVSNHLKRKDRARL